MTPIVTIRPAPGDAATVAAGAEQGLAIIAHPLFSVTPCEWSPPPAADFDAVLFGSANALRHGGAALGTLTALPALCVGEATAGAAREAGFTVADTGARGLASVLPLAARHGWDRLLRLSGEAHVPLDAPPPTRIETRVLYRVAAREIDAELATILRGGAVVLLHSGEAARHFAMECSAREIDRGAIALACLAPRIAAMAGEGWRRVAIAENPRESALLASVEAICRTPWTEN